MDKKNLSKRLNLVMKYLLRKNPDEFKTATAVAKYIKYPQSNLSAALKGNERYLGEAIIEKFVNAFPEISYSWLKEGKGEMFSNDSDFPKKQKAPDFSPSQMIPEFSQWLDDYDKSKPEPLPDPMDQLAKVRGKKGDIQKGAIKPHFQTIEAYELPVVGRLGLGSTFYDERYFEDKLNKVKLSVSNKPSNVKRFILAEFEGDSMTDDGSPDSIPSDSWLLLAEKHNSDWNDKMTGKIMGFYDRNGNFTVKRVKEHNQTFRTVKLEALNPNKDDKENEDRTLDLKDCWAVYEYLGKQDY